jgi:hypothetical protein
MHYDTLTVNEFKWCVARKPCLRISAFRYGRRRKQLFSRCVQRGVPHMGRAPPRLLRAPRKRPRRRRAAEKHDELAPFHLVLPNKILGSCHAPQNIAHQDMGYGPTTPRWRGPGARTATSGRSESSRVI